MIRSIKIVAIAITCCAIAVAGSDVFAGKGGKGGGGSRGGGGHGGSRGGGSRSFSGGGGHHGGSSRGGSSRSFSGSSRSRSSGSFSGSGGRSRSRSFSGSSGGSGSSKGSRHFGSSSSGIQQSGQGSSSKFRRGGSGSSGLNAGSNKGSRSDFKGSNSKGRRDGNLGDNQFDGRRGDSIGRTSNFRGGRGDGRFDGDWNRRGGKGNNWNKWGWNGRGRNRHNHWHRGFWGWGGFGYRPWWGFGSSLVGFGIGYNNWGYNPYYYSGWNTWGYSPWGYDAYYYNPYYVSPLVIGPTTVDYSQPLVMASPTTGDDYGLGDSTGPEVYDAQSALAMHTFNQAREEFRNGDYPAALDSVHRAIADSPNDPALHEFRGLVLFAQGNYQEAAATVHAVLSGGPGWDWETMSGLYPSVDVYTTQLRALEGYARENPESADARFLLGYHYLTEGYQDAGVRQFQRVLEIQPDDALAQRIVQSTQPGESGSEDVPLVIPGPTLATPDGEPVESELVETPPPELPGSNADAAEEAAVKLTTEQMSGSWAADNEQGSSFQLDLAEDGTFTWQYTQEGQTRSIEGNYKVADDLLILESDSGPPMIGRISEPGADSFNFRILGTADEDPGLKFSK